MITILCKGGRYSIWSSGVSRMDGWEGLQNCTKQRGCGVGNFGKIPLMHPEKLHLCATRQG